MKPTFIAFEGIDGSGKSTQIKRLQQRLTQENKDVFVTCEPTNEDIGKLIRQIFSGNRDSNAYAIAGLFLADRMEHILNANDGLLKMLKDGYHILSDRYYLSSYAYHGAHVDIDWVIDMNKVAVNYLKPNAHFFIDISPEKSIERIQKGRLSKEIYETLDNLTAVRHKYYESIQKISAYENVIIINGDNDENTIAEEIYTNFLKVAICN